MLQYNCRIKIGGLFAWELTLAKPNFSLDFYARKNKGTPHVSDVKKYKNAGGMYGKIL